MRNPKFKVGDKVKVLRATTKEEDSHSVWYNSWNKDGMDCMVGQEYCVDYVNTWSDGDTMYPQYCLGGNYSFPEFVLQDITIGKQLLFSFMGEKNEV